MRKVILLLFFVKLVFSSCSKDEVYTSIDNQTNETKIYTTGIDLELLETIEESSRLESFMLPDGTDYSKIPQDPRNLITKEKVDLGKLLVHDTATGSNPGLSSNLFTFACATCHPVASSFFFWK